MALATASDVFVKKPYIQLPTKNNAIIIPTIDDKTVLTCFMRTIRASHPPLKRAMLLNDKSVRTVSCLSYNQASRIAYGLDKQQSPTLGGYIESDFADSI